MRDQAIAKHRPVRRRQTRPQGAPGERRRTWLRRLAHGASYLTYLVVLILSGWLLYYSLESSYFQVHDIAVSATALLDPARVRDASGILGANALLVRDEVVEQSLLKLAETKEAHVEVSLGGTASVDVVERTPLVQWKRREGSFLVDRAGLVFSVQPPRGRIAEIRDIDGPRVEIGSTVDADAIKTVDYLESALPAKSGIRPQGYDYSVSTGVTVPVDGGPRIIIGDSTDLDAKLSALAAIREHLDATKGRAELIDLRFRGRPTYVLVNPTPPAKPSPTR